MSPCRGPCCKKADGTRGSGQDFSRECYLDSGHPGPCSIDRSFQSYRDARQEDAEALHLTRVTKTALLCSACRVLERLSYDFDENPALSQWWAQHKEEDGEAG